MSNDLKEDDDFEELYGEWDPSLYSAAQIDAERFALLVGGPRYDDPYTIILTHDGRLEQPWSRFDVRREIQSISVAHNFPGDADYLAISLNGDLYEIGQTLEWKTIPGTPTEATDNSDIFISGFAWIGDEYVVSGDQGFLRAGQDRQWRGVAPRIDDGYPYASPTWRIVGIDDQSNLYIAAYRKADPRHFNFYPGHHPDYKEGLTEDEVSEKKKQLRSEQYSYPQRLSVFVGKPEEWQEISLPERIRESPFTNASDLTSIISQPSGDVYILGSHGLILAGNKGTGYREATSIVDHDLDFIDGVMFLNQLVVHANHKLLRFNGHVASDFVPKIKISSPPYFLQAAEIQAFDGNMFIFDFVRKIRIFDGNVWKTVEVPQELIERPFRG